MILVTSFQEHFYFAFFNNVSLSLRRNELLCSECVISLSSLGIFAEMKQVHKQQIIWSVSFLGITCGIAGISLVIKMSGHSFPGMHVGVTDNISLSSMFHHSLPGMLGAVTEFLPRQNVWLLFPCYVLENYIYLLCRIFCCSFLGISGGMSYLYVHGLSHLFLIIVSASGGWDGRRC